MTKILKKCTGK